MRILQVTHTIRMIGGTERAVGTLANLLQAAGHTVAVAHADLPAVAAGGHLDQLHPDITSLFISGLFDKWPPGIHTLQSLSRALAVIRDWQPDVIHLHDMHHVVAAAVLAREYATVRTHHTAFMICPSAQKLKYATGRICTQPFGWRCLITTRTADCTRMDDGRQMRVRHITRTLAKITALRAINQRIGRNIVSSEYMRRELVRAGYSADRISVIPLGVEIPTVDLSQEACARETPLLLTLGRLVDLKGIHILLAALAQVRRPWHLMIAGDGPARQALEAQVRRLQLTPQVTFTGWIEDIGHLLASSDPDLVIMPTLGPETFGLSGLESLAHGIPVLAFAGGAVPEWLHHGESGWLAPSRDIAGLVETLQHVLQLSSAQRRAYGAAGRRFVTANFSLTTYRKRVELCYEQAIAGGDLSLS